MQPAHRRFSKALRSSWPQSALKNILVQDQPDSPRPPPKISKPSSAVQGRLHSDICTCQCNAYGIKYKTAAVVPLIMAGGHQQVRSLPCAATESVMCSSKGHG